MRQFLYSFIVIIIMMVGCSSEEEHLYSSEGRDPIISETEAGDFIIRLQSSKGIYKEDESVKIVAKLKYVGEEDSITIFYGESPFLYDITETELGIHATNIHQRLENPTNEQLLDRGEWLEKEFNKTFLSASDEEYLESFEWFLDGEGFPAGNYEIELRTDFLTLNVDDDEFQQHNYSTNIMLKSE
ncbi:MULTISPECIES: hypothetical protein [Bacillaceae]|uniref:Uncharacterized protein n=1 Tax=Evansella alkalicola TaxID=745819 RepID=A0ABS6JRZ9_9BACI|nr:MULTISPECIES: hypothetical protein [Bacillaceae]MBU9720841.1 hypothetical protein [Bacillus alkalicola]